MKIQMTSLEEKVMKLYLEMGIEIPSRINMNEIANYLDIWIHLYDGESQVFKRRGLYSMFLNESLTPEEQWQDFGHEIGHVIKHVGDQHKLRIAFRELQEFQANNFMYHFCVPTFMLLDYEISNFMNIEDGVPFILEKFPVTEEFAKKRLLMLSNQMQLSNSDYLIRQKINSGQQKKAENWSPETKALLKKLYRQLDKSKEGVTA